MPGNAWRRHQSSATYPGSTVPLSLAQVLMEDNQLSPTQLLGPASELAQVGTAPSRQFGCGHPVSQQGHGLFCCHIQASDSDTALVPQCWGQTVKLTDPTTLCKRCIPKSNAHSHTAWFWIRISSMMCSYCIGTVFSETLSLSLWKLQVAEYTVWNGWDLALCYQAELMQRSASMKTGKLLSSSPAKFKLLSFNQKRTKQQSNKKENQKSCYLKSNFNLLLDWQDDYVFPNNVIPFSYSDGTELSMNQTTMLVLPMEFLLTGQSAAELMKKTPQLYKISSL